MVAITSCTGGGAATSPFRPTLQWQKCPSDVEIQYFSRHRCGWLTGAGGSLPACREDHPTAGGGDVAVGEPALAGLNSGFGSDLGNGYDYTDRAAGSTRTHHIGVNLELRGTGDSEPSLACPEVDALDPLQARAPTGESSLLSHFLAAVAACHDRLTAEGVTLADFDIQNSVEDMEDLRVALGIDRWAFLSSYGTGSRYLFEYLREFPGRVGGAWMDSPQFPQVDEVSAGIDGTRYALDQLFKACANDEACSTSYPDLRTSWKQALTRLKRRPLLESVTVDAGKLLRAARFAPRWRRAREPDLVAGDDFRSSPWPARPAPRRDRGGRSSVLFRVSPLLHPKRYGAIQSRRLPDRAVSR